MKNKTKINMMIAISILSIVVTAYSIQPQFILATEPTVLSVSHTPIAVTHQTNVTVTVTVDDDVNITGMQIQYCSLLPTFSCHFPKIDMIQESTNVWEGSFIVEEESGTIGYEIHITHNEGLIIAPNSTDYLGYSNIAEPSPGIFYFTIELDANTASAPLNLGVPLILSSFATTIIIRKRIKR